MATHHRRRLLVVDDEETTLEVLAHHLEDDFAVDRAMSGPEALERLASGPLPDAILLDVNMPGMDGYDLCAKIKATPRTTHVPVLFVTSLDGDEALCFEVGAEDFVPKPVVADVLRNRLMNQLQLFDALAEATRLEFELEATQAECGRLERRQGKLLEIIHRRSGSTLEPLPRTGT